MKTIQTLITLACVLSSGDIFARGINYSDYSLTKAAELIIQGEVVECRADGTYQVQVNRVLKGQFADKVLELPYRYFYERTTEWKALPLAKRAKAVVFFLRYTVNGEDDDMYLTYINKVMGGDPVKNRQRMPYRKGYEIIAGVEGVYMRENQEELEGLGSSIRMIDQFIREKKVDLLVKFFVSGSASRRIALDALYDNHKMFDMNKKLVGEHLVQCLGDSDSRVRNHASWVISHFDYREATAALNSYTNTPDDNFREALLSTLKIFEMRGPKKNGP